MVIIGLTLTFLLGYGILILIGAKFRNLTTISLSFLLGIGFQTLFMYYMSVSNIKIDLISVSILLMGVIFVVNLISYYKGSGTSLDFFKILIIEAKDKYKFFWIYSPTEKILSLIIVGLFMLIFFTGLYWPVAGWDSIALYDFRAKVVYETGYIWDAVNRGYFFGYPLMTSMMNVWVYLLGSNYPRFMYSMIYISASVIFADILSNTASRKKTLFFSLLLVLSPPMFAHSSFDYANMPYTVYFFVSTIILYVWTLKKQNYLLITSSLMMGLATWVRSTDPFWVVNIVMLLIWCLANKKIKPIFIYLLLFIPIQQSWNLFLTKMSELSATQTIISGATDALFKTIDFVRLGQVSYFVVKVVGPMLAVYFLLAIISFLIGKRNYLRDLYLYLLVGGNVALLFVGSYVFSYIWSGWSLIGESLGRMSMVFVPLLIFFSGIVGPDISDKK